MLSANFGQCVCTLVRETDLFALLVCAAVVLAVVRCATCVVVVFVVCAHIGDVGRAETVCASSGWTQSVNLLNLCVLAFFEY